MATSDNFRSPIPFYRQQLSVIYQSDLRKYVERISENKMWIMQFRSGRTNFPEAEKVIGSATRGVYDQGGISVYETVSTAADGVRPIREINGLRVSSQTDSDLQWLKETYPNEHGLIIDILSRQGVDVSTIN